MSLRGLLPLALLVALGAGALVFDLTLPSRLPSTADWAEAAAALRARGQPGDGLQIWPPWAERARLVVDAMAVFTDEDLRRADYVGVRRLWLLALPSAPRGHLERAREALRSRGAAPLADALRFGALSLEPWDLRSPPLASELTSAPEWHEVDYVARRCRRLDFGRPLELREPAPGGKVLHLRAGIEGDRAYDLSLPPVVLSASADGLSLPPLEVKPGPEPAPAWQGIDVPLPEGRSERRFTFVAHGRDGSGRRVCFSAWTTR